MESAPPRTLVRTSSGTGSSQSTVDLSLFSLKNSFIQTPESNPPTDSEDGEEGESKSMHETTNASIIIPTSGNTSSSRSRSESSVLRATETPTTSGKHFLSEVLTIDKDKDILQWLSNEPEEFNEDISSNSQERTLDPLTQDTAAAEDFLPFSHETMRGAEHSSNKNDDLILMQSPFHFQSESFEERPRTDMISSPPDKEATCGIQIPVLTSARHLSNIDHVGLDSRFSTSSRDIYGSSIENRLSITDDYQIRGISDALQILDMDGEVSSVDTMLGRRTSSSHQALPSQELDYELDDDIMKSEEWTSFVGQVEVDVLHRSYLWYSNRKDENTIQSCTSAETASSWQLYTDLRLPVTCPATCLETWWNDFGFTDEICELFFADDFVDDGSSIRVHEVLKVNCSIRAVLTAYQSQREGKLGSHPKPSQGSVFKRALSIFKRALIDRPGGKDSKLLEFKKGDIVNIIEGDLDGGTSPQHRGDMWLARIERSNRIGWVRPIWFEDVAAHSNVSHDQSFGNRCPDIPASPQSVDLHRAEKIKQLDLGEGTLGYKSCIESLIRSRNILVSACRTVEHLRQKRVCTDGISLFVHDAYDIARLISFKESELATMTERLDLTIRAAVWALRSRFMLPYTQDSEMPEPDCCSTFLEVGFLHKIENEYDLGQLRLFWSSFAQIIDVAIVSYCGAHVVSAPEHYSALNQLAIDEIIDMNKEDHSTFAFCMAHLGCMDTFLHGEKIWTLRSTRDARLASPALPLSAYVKDLADVWGPLWSISKAESSTEISGCKFYAIGTGAIGRIREYQTALQGQWSNEILCHYVDSLSQIESQLLPLEEDPSKRLLIGAVSAGLKREEFCTTTPSDGLTGISLRPYGTSKDTKTKSSSQYNFALGYSGVQIGYTRQYVLRHGRTRKQSMIARWSLEPERRNPDILSLWCGLEVSLCTRNAARRKIIHVLGSETMREYFCSGLFEWNDPRCEAAFFRAVASHENTLSVIYKLKKEWRNDIGKAISWLFTALGDTGITSTGDLETLSMQNGPDSECLATIPASQHTWAGLLKESIHSATFAIASSSCLSFRYFGEEGLQGQRCRLFKSSKEQYSVLETAVVPVPPYEASNPSWSSEVPVEKCLALEAAKAQMLKVKWHLPGNALLVHWSNVEFLRAASVCLVGDTAVVRYRERISDSQEELRVAVRTFVISKRVNKLPRPCLRQRSGKMPFSVDTKLKGQWSKTESMRYDPSKPIAIAPDTPESLASKDSNDGESPSPLANKSDHTNHMHTLGNDFSWEPVSNKLSKVTRYLTQCNSCTRMNVISTAFDPPFNDICDECILTSDEGCSSLPIRRKYISGSLSPPLTASKSS